MHIDFEPSEFGYAEGAYVPATLSLIYLGVVSERRGLPLINAQVCQFTDVHVSSHSSFRLEDGYRANTMVHLLHRLEDEEDEEDQYSKDNKKVVRALRK